MLRKGVVHEPKSEEQLIVVGNMPSTQNSLRGKFMSIARIIWLISLLAAVVLSFVDLAQAGMVLAVLGLVAGYFADAEHRLGLIVAAIFLAGGAAAWGSIPGVGEYLTAIFKNYSMVLSAGALMAVCKTTVERVFLGKGVGS